MIDIENKVFTNISTAVKAQYSSAKVYGEYVAVPEGFPCVNFVESDNYVYQDSITLDSRENHAYVTYEAQVFTNDNKKKETAKKIANIIDTQMNDMGFVRTFTEQIPNYDRTVYRLIMRYSGVVSKGVVNGTTTTHLIYKA